MQGAYARQHFVSEVFAPHDCIVSRFSFATFLAEEKSGQKCAAAALLSLKFNFRPQYACNPAFGWCRKLCVS